MKSVKDSLVAHLYSDHLRLSYFCFDDRPPGIDFIDLFRATSICSPIGAATPELEKKLDIHPIEPIERVCEALVNHANTLSELKADAEVGAPSRHQNAVPASTISFLAWEMLVRCNNSGILPPVALLKLLRLRLGIRSREKSDEDEELAWKLEDASRFAFINPDASLRQIAKHYDVNISTVSRWDKEYNLKERGKNLQHMCDEIDRQWKAIHAKIRKENE